MGKMMSGIQKDRAIKEILDENMAKMGETEYKSKKKLNKKDKELAHDMGEIDGGGKTKEVESSVTEKPSKEINKSQSKLKSDDSDEEEEDHHEEKGGDGDHKEGGEAKGGDGDGDHHEEGGEKEGKGKGKG